MYPTCCRVTLRTKFLFINHSQYGISNGNLSRCNTGLEEAANTTIIKITWLATWVPALLRLRHLDIVFLTRLYLVYFNHFKTAAKQKHQEMNHKKKHFFEYCLPYFVKKYYLCAKVCCLHF